ncbi:lysosomal-trafficking regulator-like isoform X2 [Mytilus californianus]|uniref:lysosomal-trafficking regulator-like isoform X2 n=1 Tax=Mytilus californianus TaxID=6549 RepID=UPI002245254C|nr:lysosomal-trafficking regulator-like isoform X2 [Mytilus californianus]
MAVKLSIKEIWDIYSSARKHPNQEQTKSLALDTFLALCCKEIEENGDVPIIYDMKTIVNQLCNEFMNDIIRITNKAEDDGDPATLESYLVKDRGWQLLYVIYKNGIQGLTVGRDFSNLIVSLLPWCLKFKTNFKDLKLVSEEEVLPSISSCFYHLHKSNKWMQSCQRRDKVVPKSKHRKPIKKPVNYRPKKQRIIPEKELESTNSEEDTLNVPASPPKFKKSRNIFRHNPYVSFGGKTIQDEENISEEENEEIALILSRIDVDKKEMSPPEISQLILDLLLEICLQDLNQISPSKVLSPSVLPHLTHVLTSFYPKSNIDNEKILASEWTKSSNIHFQRKLLRVILTLCGAIAVQQNGVNIIAGHRCLQDLLDIAQQIYNLQNIKKELSAGNHTEAENGSQNNYDLDLCFLTEIVLSTTILLDIIFQCLPLNLVFISNAVKLVRDFIDGNGFILLDFVLCHLDWLRTQSYTHSDWSHSEPIRLIDSFLNTLKSVKVNYIHSMKCLKNKHQRCEFSVYFNHHHNILGSSYTVFQEMSSDEKQNAGKSEGVCLIASWCTFLLDILFKLECKLSRIEILKTLSLSGICCCMNLEVVVSGVLKCLPKFSPPVQNFALETMNTIILDNFSGRKLNHSVYVQSKSPPFACSVCFDRGSYQTNNESGNSHHAVDSGFSSHGMKIEKKFSDFEFSKWSVCNMYKDILFSQNQQLAELTSKQLLNLVINGTEDLKEELFFRVYTFTFSSFLGTLRSNSPCSSEEEQNKNVEFSKKVKVHCLSALPNLLEVESVLNEFLENKGIGRICQLLEDESLRNPVLKIFEALVILDQGKLTDSDIIYSQTSTFSQVLPKNGLVMKAFIGGLASKTAKDTCMGDETVDINDFVQMFDCCDVQFCCQNFAHIMTRNLPLLVDMWETCARICLYSKRFVFHFQNSPCLKIAENALLVIIKQLLCYNKCDLPKGSEDSGLDLDISKVPTNSSSCFLKLMLMKSLLIICSASYKSLTKKDGQEISMWSRLKEAFQGCSKLPPTKVKTVCDIILSSAMPKKTTVFDHSKLESLSELFIKDDDIDDDEIRQYLHTTSDEDYDSLMFGEGGYYGDTECGSDDNDIQLKSMENGYGMEIYPAVFRILVELMIRIQHEENITDVLSQILHKLLQTLRASHKATQAVCHEGLLEDILTGFWTLLIEDNGGTSVRNSLLSLIQLLAQHRVTSTELQKILQLFNYANIPQELLLSTFLSIVENSKSQPHYSVLFPCKRTFEVSPKSGLVQSTLRIKDRKLSSGSYSPFFASISPAMITSPDVTDTGLDLFDTTSTQDVWDIAAMFIPIKGLPWPPLEQGLTVASWVKLSEDQENIVKISKTTSGNHVYFSSSEVFGSKEHLFHGKCTFEISNCLHLVSIGNTEKMLEVWVHSKSGYILVRLTTEYGESGHILKDVISKECLMKGHWHHVLVSYNEKVDATKTHSKDDITYFGKVTLVIDGWRSQEIKLEHQHSVTRKQMDRIPLLCIGHACTDPEQSSQTLTLSSLMILEGRSHGSDEIFHLYALGPSCVTINKCDNVNMDISYGPLLTKQMELHSKMPADILVGSKRVDLDSLRSSLILTYNPMMHDLACFYRNTSSQEMQILGPNLGIPQRQDSSNLLIQQPITAQLTCQAKLVTHRHHSLEKALEGAGGMEAILFLVAKVFELNKCDNHQNDSLHELLQAKSLQILFALVNFSTYQSKDFMIINGNQLLNRVLTSSKAVLGFHTLKVLLDAATSESMLRFEPDGTLVMRRKSEAMITNISVIVDLLLNWRIWEGADDNILVMIFHVLASLVRDDHPHQAFNLKQFHSINLISKIFKIYQEKIQDNMKAYSAEIAQSVISILQSMLGTPPDIHIIMSICDFLLFVHPATNSYVNHTKNSFCFVTWWNEKSPSKRKDSIFVKHSLNITSTPYGKKIEKLTSDENTDMKAKRTLDLSTDNTITNPEDSSCPGSDIDNTIQATKSDDLSNEEEVRTEPKNLSEENEEIIETVSDLEKSDSGSNMTHTSEENYKLIERRLSVGSSGERRFSLGSSEGGSPRAEKFTKLSLLKKMGAYASSGSLSREMSTDDEEGLYAPRPEVDFDEDDDELEAEKGLVALCVGLLETLTNVMITLPDNKISNVFQKVIKPDIALVLAHHSSPQIRTAVIQVIKAYLLRAGEKLVEEFMQKQSFHLLAVQLHNYPSHTEQIEEVVSFILGKPFTFEMSSITIDEEPNELQQAAFAVFLSLIENTYRDVALCHNTLTLVIQMFEKNDMISSLMLDNRIIEVITNLVARINSITTRFTDMEGIDEYQLILEDIQMLLCKIAIREFRCSGNTHIQQCEEILDLLKLLEHVEEIVYGKNSKQTETVKALQFVVVLCVLTFVESESQEGTINVKSKPYKRTTSTYGSKITMLFPSTSIRPYKPTPTFQNQGTNKVTTFVDQPFEDSRDKKFHISQKPNLVSRAFSVDSKPAGILGTILGLGKKKRNEFIPFSQSEFIDRLKKWVVISVDLIVLSKLEEIKKTPGKKKLNLLEKPEPVTIETKYIRRLFEFLYRALEVTLSQDRILPRKEKNLIMWGAKDIVRVQIGRLITFMLSPRCQFDDRTFLLSYVQGELRGREILRTVLSTNSEVGTEMGFHIYDLCTSWKDWLISQQRDYALQFLNILKSEKFTVFSPSSVLTETQIVQLNDERRLMASKLEQGRENLRKKKKPIYDRLKTKNEKLYQVLSKQAMDVTQNVTQLQTHERNKMIEHVKKKMTEKIQIKKMWQELVQNLTHERAVWHCQKSYPKSWQLDPTEGPGRVRKRLKRCHLGLNSRFLLTQHKEKLEAENIDPPLIYLFEDDHQMSDSAALIYQLYRNEKIQHTCKCTAVAPNSQSKGELLVGENSVFFVADEAITDANYTQVLLGNKDQLSMTWPYDEIREIHKRWYQLRDSALEIFHTNGKTCLLACEHKQDRDDLYERFMKFELSNYVQTENIEDITRMWKDSLMTNYDYLTHLNKLAGRSFNDLMQYPVFPFILKDYVSEKLDLLKADSYRNFSKPISVQDESKEKKYKDNYEALKAEFERYEDQSTIGVGPYHYGSHYSNSGIVLHFLVRLPPYTKMFVSYQDNNFDIPDRTFHNMETCWRLASSQSTTDFKEMIPEFFFFPEFLRNFEGFDFGKRQNNEDVSDVTLPAWCKNNPRLFIIILRQALEADYVRQNLHNWIDLVFGYKQQGEAAIKAVNVFHPATYFGINVDGVQDRLKRQALKTMVNTYGQTPKQLFRHPHPPGSFVRESMSKVISQLVQQSYSVSVEKDFDHGFVYVPSPLETVEGLKWGNYIGSPANPPPKVVWQEKYSQVVASLLPLPTGDVIGVGVDTCCLTMHSKQKGSTLYNTTDVVWAAIVTWKFPDGIIRINNKPEQPYLNLIQHSPYDQVTYIAAIADCPHLFVGCESGSITVYQTVFNQAKTSDIQIKGVKHVLYGHTKRITQIVICKAYSIFVSASEDRTCIIWDLNRLSYVRSIEGHRQGVDVVAISPTAGDIASASRQGLGSCLLLHSINGEYIDIYTSQDHVINCLAFSTAPEGQSINVIAGGLDNGVIRIWSTVDLRHLRDLQTENLMLKPVMSVVFTYDSHRLYSTLSDGTVALWESPSSSKQLLPHKFVAFL